MKGTDERVPENTRIVNIDADWEVQYWSKALGCNINELLEAVKTAGHTRGAVKWYLNK